MMMTKKTNTEPRILLDCDVIIHFTKAGQQLLLPKIFPNRFVILDKVKAELDKRKKSIVALDNFIEWSKIEVIPPHWRSFATSDYFNLYHKHSVCNAVF